MLLPPLVIVPLQFPPSAIGNDGVAKCHCAASVANAAAATGALLPEKVLFVMINPPDVENAAAVTRPLALLPEKVLFAMVELRAIVENAAAAARAVAGEGAVPDGQRRVVENAAAGTAGGAVAGEGAVR